MSCRKIRYQSRGHATRAKREIGDRSLRAYTCPHCTFWHLGHLPEAIRRGLKTRGEIYGGDEAA